MKQKTPALAQEARKKKIKSPQIIKLNKEAPKGYRAEEKLEYPVRAKTKEKILKRLSEMMRASSVRRVLRSMEHVSKACLSAQVNGGGLGDDQQCIPPGRS